MLLNVHYFKIGIKNIALVLSYWKHACNVHCTLNNYLFFINDWQFFPGINGWLPPRLAMEIVHNRTVNLHGGFGKNIPMDLMCEFINDDFKGKYLWQMCFSLSKY